MAEDLRHFLGRAAAEQPAAPVGVAATPAPGAVPPPATPTAPLPSSDRRPLKIVPKGLRSFDDGDADFFLQLLPGPRDRDGLPESIRFWKGRIEETDPDRTFGVGLIYGPSGCGKSSLVKAGLLPRLADHVLTVYVEATAEETEGRLLRGLRKRRPDLPADKGLTETLAALRRGQGAAAGKKVLLVIDQFEQWLHSRSQREHDELVLALRQCDGVHVQCVVLVRDDFWMAATRFMRELEIDLAPGQNTAAVDLFDLRHARRVLAAFGRAFGTLPEGSAEPSKEQEAFLDQAVGGLSQDGRVVCVRLALFAEMVKGKPWTPATLRDVGGAEGVGVAFLEETFAARTAPPHHRLHQQAARAVLKALLPEQGTDIKGNMRSRADLLEASGCARRPRDFDELLRILDGEVRLITPTEPEGEENAGVAAFARTRANPEVAASPHSGECGYTRYYQLTHDYLVPSLREWLTRKQKETRRGRAELRLAERAALWNVRPENRRLPSLPEWLNIRLLTRKKDWTPPQRKMMGKAARYHLVRGGGPGGGLDAFDGDRVVHPRPGRRAEQGRPCRGFGAAASRRGHRQGAGNHPGDGGLSAMGRSAAPRRLRRGGAGGEGGRQRGGADPAGAPAAARRPGPAAGGRRPDRLPLRPPARRRAAGNHGRRQGAIRPQGRLDRASLGRDGTSRTKGARTGGCGRRPPWRPTTRTASAGTAAAGPVVDRLVEVNPAFLADWMEALRPVREKLTAPLAVVFRDRTAERTAERSLATSVLADYAADRPETLADLLMDADDKQFVVLFPKVQANAGPAAALLNETIGKKLDAEKTDDDKEHLAKRQANAAVALLRLGQPDGVWPLLKHSPDPRVRSYLIHYLSPRGADAGAVVRRLDEEKDVSIQPGVDSRLARRSLGRAGAADPAESLRGRKGLLAERCCNCTGKIRTPECAGRRSGCCGSGGSGDELQQNGPRAAAKDKEGPGEKLEQIMQGAGGRAAGVSRLMRGSPAPPGTSTVRVRRWS